MANPTVSGGDEEEAPWATLGERVVMTGVCLTADTEHPWQQNDVEMYFSSQDSFPQHATTTANNSYRPAIFSPFNLLYPLASAL